MKVSFNILKGDISWQSSIHQLNSDVLLRHVRVNGNVGDPDMEFSYCEKKHQGDILNSASQLIGTFHISF